MRWKLGLLAVTLAVLVVRPVAAVDAPVTVPKIKHVWVIVHENKNYAQIWAPDSPAPYLAKTLRAKGKLLTNYYATAHVSLGNYITMISGQPGNLVTQTDCQTFIDFARVAPDLDGVAVGQGCVYPADVKTLPDQLEAKGLTWKGYMEDMGNDPVRDNGTTCAHPDVGPVSQDHTQSAQVGDQYATRHNPFVYFHSIIDRPAVCNANVVPLSRLQADLASPSGAATFNFITPNLCNDGHDAPCVDGAPGGLVQIGRFTELWAPRILNSPAFKDGGLLIVTFDESEIQGDAGACCNQPTGPNTPLPGLYGPGGGRIGALLVSSFIKPGTTSDVPYNHYSFLRSMEDLFGLSHLGYAAMDGLRPFGADVYDNLAGATPPPAVANAGELAASGRDSSLALATAVALLAFAIVWARRTPSRARPRRGSR